jgi:hypothetical protein
VISWLLALGLAWGGEQPEVTAQIHGDVKAFFVASFPYESVLFPDASPTGVGMVDGRLKMEAEAGPFKGVFHHAITATAPSATAATGAVGTGVGRTAPEAIPLTWIGADGEGMRVQGRTDRLFLKLSVPHFDMTLGRQAVSFGHGAFFTPMDLVSPFFPTTIDQEYKPGIDAIRFDGYVGMSVFTALVAYSGTDPLTEATALEAENAYDPAVDTTVAVYAQTTVGVTDMGAFYGYLYGDHVAGVTVSSAIGPVGVYGDVTVTAPRSEEEDVFARGVLGMFYRPFETSTLSAELYAQSLGTGDASQYLATSLGERWQRGELWLSGRYYLGMAWSQEIRPTLTGNVAVIMNLADPSAFIAPTLAWSVSSNAEVGVGAYFGVGARPSDDVDPADLLQATLEGASDAEVAGMLGVRSEFGTYPHAGFVQLKAYF